MWSETRTRLALLCLVVFSATVGVKGQLNRGVIEGIVTDPQGAFVPGVEVTLTNVDTNVSVPTKTNNVGYFRVVDLVPGKYRARFMASGFSPHDLTNIDVPAGQTVRTDVELKLGAARETVQVTAEATLVETAPTNVSTGVEGRLIQDLPLAGRDLQQLVLLVPGIVTAGPPGSNFGFNSQYGTFPDPTFLLGSTVSVNGGQAGSNAWYLDGNLNLSGLSENIVVNPSQDSVSEFQVVTNALSAEYGRTGGGVFSVVLKSGTNSVHGNIYEYIRNDKTNARNPFTSIDAFGNKIKERQLRYNNFGGTLGGPVVLPGYNGRNKTFFFFSWDTSILHLLGTKTFTVPTPRMRQGDFSEDPNAAVYGIWDPFTTQGPASDGTFARSAFGTPIAGSPIGCTGRLAPDGSTAINPTAADCAFATQVPPNRLDPVAMFFMNSFPDPNFLDPIGGCPPAAGGAFSQCSNFLGSVGSSQNLHNMSIKIDHVTSERSRWFGEWLFNPGRIDNYRLPWTGPTFPHGQVGWSSVYPLDMRNQIIALGNSYSLSPTLLNEFRVSFTRQFHTTHPDQAGYPDEITNLSAVRQLLAPVRLPAGGRGAVAPEWFIYPSAGGSIQFGPASWVNNHMASEAYTILDNITKIVGKHTLKTGFMYRLQHLAWFTPGPAQQTFTGGGVRNPVTGLGGGGGIAQFMLGAVMNDRSSYLLSSWDPYSRYRYWGAYFQDDWRITPRFTLNLGLRWELFGSWNARQHPISRFCLECDNSDTGRPGIVVYEGDPGFKYGADIVPPNWNSFGPRINFSWAPFADRKTVFRGGYDIFYSNAYSAINSAQMMTNANGYQFRYEYPRSFFPGCADFTTQCVAWPLSDTTVDKGSLTVPPYSTIFPAQRRDPMYALGVNFPEKPERDPMVQTWGLEVQRELPGNLALSIGYVGMHGTHLPGGPFYDWTRVHTKDRLQYRLALYDAVPITQYYSGRTAEKLEEVWGSSELPRSLLLRDYPFWNWVNSSAVFYGTSIYHGMNVRVQKRYSQGLSFIAAYTASKKINNPMTGQNFFTVVDPIHFARPGWVGGRSGQLAWSSGLLASFQDPDNFNADRAIGADDIPQILNVAATYELPFGSGRRFQNTKGPLNHLIGGWLLTTNFNVQKGVPLTISGPCNGLTCRPNLIGDPSFPGGRSEEERKNQWINPAAFEGPFGSDPAVIQAISTGSYPDGTPFDYNSDVYWRFGNAGSSLPGIRSPGFWNVDTALAKRFNVSEEKFFEFRWEMFNALNHQNLGFPNTGFCLPPGPNGETDVVRRLGCSFGRISNIQTDPRSMQFALKFVW